MNTYWSQHEVFLFGQLALFPQSLEGKKVDATQLVHLFASNPVPALREYERKGYFTVETTLDTAYIDQQNALIKMAGRVDVGFDGHFTLPDENYDLGKTVYSKVKEQLPLTAVEVNSLLNDTTSQYLRFKLTDIQSERFNNELIDYLSDYKNDELTTGRETDPVNFASQRTELLNALAKYRQQYGNRPTIKSTDVATLTFWELILSHQFITGDVEIINMGYDDRASEIASGISYRHTGTTAFAKLKIVNEQLQESTPETITTATPERKIPLAARATIRARSVLIILTTTNEVFEIARLQEGFAPYQFMYHIAVKNDGGEFSLDDIHEDVSATSTRNSLAILVHDSGFDRFLKEYFFEKSNKDAIEFNTVVDLTTTKLNNLREYLYKNYKLFSGS